MGKNNEAYGRQRADTRNSKGFHGRSIKALAITSSALIAISAFVPRAHAIDWTGATNSDFATGSNWVGGIAPGAGDSVTINTSANNIATVTSSLNINELTATGAATPGTLDIHSGETVTVNTNTLLSGTGYITGAGTLDVIGEFHQNSGTIDATNLRSGTYDIDAGTINTILRSRASPTGPILVDIDGGTFSGTTAMMNLAGGGQNIDISIADASLLQTDGQITAATTGSGTIDITTDSAMLVAVASTTAIDADTVNGDITINLNGDVKRSGGGIEATASGSGNVTVQGSGTITNTDNGSGIVVQSNSGSVTIGGTGAIDLTDGGANTNNNVAAISAQIDSGSGDILINRSGDITTGTSSAIRAYNDGSGDVIITGTGDLSSQGNLFGVLDARARNGGNVVISTGGTINGNAFGIRAEAHGGGNNGSITIDLGAAIGNSLAPIHSAIAASAGNRKTTINVDQDITSNLFGVLVEGTGTGEAEVNISAGTMTTGRGVRVYRVGTGDIDINVTGGTINAVSEAFDIDTQGNVFLDIDANATIGSAVGEVVDIDVGGSGNVYVNTFTELTSIDGNGITVDAADGLISVISRAAVSGDAAGIVARSHGSGGIFVGGIRGDAIGTGSSSYGIHVESDTGQITISGTGNAVGTGTTQGAAIHAIIDNASATTDLEVQRFGTVTGGGAFGIYARNDGSGDVIVRNTGAATVGGAFGTVIHATSTGGGNVSVSPLSTIDGGLYGIFATTLGGSENGTVTVDLGGAIGGITAPTLAGISTQTQSGRTTINIDQNITAVAAGVKALGDHTGEVLVNMSAGTVTANYGIVLAGLDNSSGNVQVSGGTVNALSGDAISMAFEFGSAIIGVSSGAVVKATDAGNAISFKSNPFGVQILQNSGTIIGEIASDDGVLNFTNSAGGVWNATSGNGGANTSALGDANDVVNNAGTIYAADTDGAFTAATVVMSGLEAVNNLGVISLQNGGSSALATDTLTITPDSGKTLTFSGGGSIHLDANLGGGTADLVTLGSANDNNATVTGTTTININHINPGVGGKVGETVNLVRVADSGAGSTNANSFLINGGSVSKGGVRYELEFVDNDASGFDLFRLIGVEQIAVPEDNIRAQAPQTMQNLFHESVKAMVDRQGDMRSQIEQRGEAGGFWAHAVGSRIDRTDTGSFKLGGVTTKSDTSFEQRIAGVFFGVDGVRQGMLSDQDHAILGLFAGYLTSDVDFKASSSTLNYSGYSIGTYATYLNDRFYSDLLLKADILEANVHDSATSASATFDAVNFGWRFGAGYKVDLAPHTYLDTFGKLTYVNSTADSYQIGTTLVDLGSNDSLRGELGVRIGKNFNADGVELDAFLSASFVHEFLPENEALIRNGNTSLVQNNNDLDFVKLGVGFDAKVDERVNLFTRATADFGSDYRNYSGQIGFNFKF